jgi:N-acetylglucosaminyldiphosphoundecaprenol N-acetyl-beta-D-mannosaminyltransferase
VVDFQRNVFCLLGLPFDSVNMTEALERVRHAAVQRTRCFVSTPNTNWVVTGRTDEPFRNSAIHSDLSIVDGMPLVWVARLLNIPIQEPVPGSTLFDQLRGSRGPQVSVFFFGGADGVAQAACERLRSENRGLTCVGFEAAGFGSIEDMSSDRLIQSINESRADFLVVALGARKGQAWIERNRAQITVPLISHLGAVMNFVAGTVKRAPRWMRRLGLEWLWRIKEEPALWLRYFRDGVTLIALVITRVLPYALYLRYHQRTAESLASASVESYDESDDYVVIVRGAWTWENLAALRDGFASAVSACKGVRLDLGEISYVDSSFVALTILLQGHLKEVGLAFRVVAAAEPVRRVVKYCCAEYLLAFQPAVVAVGPAKTLREGIPLDAARQRDAVSR